MKTWLQNSVQKHDNTKKIVCKKIEIHNEHKEACVQKILKHKMSITRHYIQIKRDTSFKHNNISFYFMDFSIFELDSLIFSWRFPEDHYVHLQNNYFNNASVCHHSDNCVVSLQALDDPDHHGHKKLGCGESRSI